MRPWALAAAGFRRRCGTADREIPSSTLVDETVPYPGRREEEEEDEDYEEEHKPRLKRSRFMRRREMHRYRAR